MWIEVFKTGEHTDSNGNIFTYTAEDLTRISNQYNAQVQTSPNSKAPLVLGHPESNEPAYGWIEMLVRRGNYLLAKISNVSSEMAEAIKNHNFTKVSISLSPNLELQHVGLLGAVNPAIKNLNPNFFEMDYSPTSDFQESNFNDETDNSEENSNIEYLNELINENTYLKSKLQEFIEENRNRNFSQFVQDLQSMGKISKLNSQNVLSALHYFQTIDIETNEKYSATVYFMNFMKTMGNNSYKSEFARKEDALTIHSTNSMINSKNLNPERKELHEKVLRYMENDTSLSYEQALAKIISNES